MKNPVLYELTDPEEPVEQEREPVGQHLLSYRICPPKQQLGMISALHRSLNQLGQQCLQHSTTKTTQLCLQFCGPVYKISHDYLTITHI